MFVLNHNDAIELEHQVRRLFKCDRGGVSGLVDADNFESNPLDAAVMVVTYIHTKGLHISETQYDEFLHKYGVIFKYSEENDAAHEVKNYIKDLKSIVESYL